LVSCSAHYFATINVPVVVTGKQAENYQIELEKQGKSALEIDRIFPEENGLQVASLIVLKKSLHAGGLPVEFTFIQSPNPSRGRLLIRNGQAIISPALIAKVAATDDIPLSSVIVNSKVILKGLYGLPSNERLSQVKSIDDLAGLTAVVNSAW